MQRYEKRFKETVKQAQTLASEVLSIHPHIEVTIDLHEGVYKYRLPNGLVLTIEPND